MIISWREKLQKSTRKRVQKVTFVFSANTIFFMNVLFRFEIMIV